MGKSYNTIHFSFLRGKQLIIILHITVWVIFFILPAYFLNNDSGIDLHSLIRAYIQILLYAIVFYMNYLWLTPQFFFKKKKVLYFITTLILIGTVTGINEFAFRRLEPNWPFERHETLKRQYFNPQNDGPVIPNDPRGFDKKRPPKNWPLYNFIITTLFISGFGMGLCFSDKLIQNEKERKEAEKEKLNTELAFLKNQINPHFFFNTLNNIYSLVQTNVDDGQKAILQLSKMMRYLLYETEKGDKLLSQEIDFMQTYIELMKLRISEKVALTVSFPREYQDFSLPPLLFLPFIENAFKHGISYRRPSFVTIKLDVLPESIVFECSNSIGSRGEDLLKSDYGIGLENVRKRLALIFPGHHELKIEESETDFNIQLQIDIPQL
jgi:two-component system, LytTR family, sensor kinase